MPKALEMFTIESLIDDVARMTGDRFEVQGEGRYMVLSLPAQPDKEFTPRGRKRIVPYLQGMVWAAEKMRETSCKTETQFRVAGNCGGENV